MLKGLLLGLKRKPNRKTDGAGAEAAKRCFEEAMKGYQSGERTAAADWCNRALELDQDNAGAWNLLARIALDELQPERALECYLRVLAIDPNEPDYLVNAAEVNRLTGRLGRALELTQQVLARHASDSRAWTVRAKALDELGRSTEAEHCLRRVHELNPEDVDAHSDLLFLLSSTDRLPPEQLAAEYRRWGELHADALSANAARHDNSPDPERVLRIGYVSADFRNHPVGRFAEPFLRWHDRAAWRVYCYSNGARPDAISTRLQGLADTWRDIHGMPDAEAAQLIRADRIDILVDLSGHTRANRLLLFARRPAPVQATWFGFLGGSGMAAMDYRITDDFVDPAGSAERRYREQLLRLPHAIACYHPPEEAPAVNALPALARGHLTFGSFNNFSKLSAQCIRTWAALLRVLPQARLRIIGAPLGEAPGHVIDLFENEGIAAGRIDMLGRLPYREYLEQYRQVDVALDSYPYNGGMTTADSLWMGVPVVSLLGRSPMSRFSACYLGSIGMASWVAATPAEYVDIAVRVAADLPELAQIRSGLRDTMRASPLLDAQGFTRDLEALFRNAWRKWCARAMERSTGC